MSSFRWILSHNHVKADTIPITTREIQTLDSAHYIHPFTDHKSLSSVGARVITRGEGVYVWDSEGKKIFTPAYRQKMARAIVEGLQAYKRVTEPTT